MAANVNVIQTSRIVANGGEITSDRYINDSSTDLSAGELCYLSGGTIKPVSSSASVINTGTSGLDAAGKFFVSLNTVDVSEDLAGNVAVQEIDPDTILEGYVVDSTSGGDVTMDTTDIGLKYAGYVDANGRFAVDGGVTSNPIFTIVDVDDNYEPYRMEGDFEKDSTGVRHQRVRFKLLNTLFA